MRDLSVLAIASAFGLASCAQPGEAVRPEQPSTESNFEVTKLFAVDGCTVYRFYDAGRFHYTTTCAGGTSSSQMSGKTTVTEEIPTAVSENPPPK